MIFCSICIYIICIYLLYVHIHLLYIVSKWAIFPRGTRNFTKDVWCLRVQQRKDAFYCFWEMFSTEMRLWRISFVVSLLVDEIFLLRKVFECVDKFKYSNSLTWMIYILISLQSKPWDILLSTFFGPFCSKRASLRKVYLRL